MTTPLWSSVPGRLRSAVARAPQSKWAVRTAYASTPSRLRILAFHGVADPAHFGNLVDAILARFLPVGESEVARALTHDVPLPPHAVWFTFDDGLASTFSAGAVLAERGVRATAFVCPSVIDRGGWLWFQAAEAALQRAGRDGTNAASSLAELKGMADADRRSAVEAILSSDTDGTRPPPPVTTADLRSWTALGHTVGNHTWDHPCLDTCTPEEQVAQVRRAHDALGEKGITPRFLAYPNGNWTVAAAAEAERLGYTGSLLFDHRLTSVDGDRHRLSRLRIDSDAPIERAMSILSGAHSTAYHLAVR